MRGDHLLNDPFRLCLEMEISGKDILLNGKKLRIRGLCRHEDHPQFGCALPYSAIAADLEIIRHLGANSVRTSHYPNDELFLDLCDEQGILVWEENHARGLSEADMKNPNFEAQAERVIEETTSGKSKQISVLNLQLAKEQGREESSFRISSNCFR